MDGAGSPSPRGAGEKMKERRIKKVVLLAAGAGFCSSVGLGYIFRLGDLSIGIILLTIGLANLALLVKVLVKG